LANIITSMRILGSIFLLGTPIYSVWFYGTYLFCGFTDIVDGIIARKTNSVSELGAKLDSAADILFVAVSTYKLLPALDMTKGLVIWFCVIAVIKVINIIFGFVLHHKFVGIHSVLNKITGMMMFMLPLSLPLVEIKYSGIAVCIIATIAAIEEGRIIRTGVAT